MMDGQDIDIIIIHECLKVVKVMKLVTTDMIEIQI